MQSNDAVAAPTTNSRSNLVASNKPNQFKSGSQGQKNVLNQMISTVYSND